MSVTVRPYRRGGWEADIRFRLPNGLRHRERCRAPVSSKSAAQRWGEDRERHLVQHGLPEPKKEVPTLEQFAERFVNGYARANRQKPSGIAAKEMILRVHLRLQLGSCRLDEITSEDVQRLKQRLNSKAPKTVNNVLTVLNSIAEVFLLLTIRRSIYSSKATKVEIGGERGIRTPGTLPGTVVFKTTAIDRSAISPREFCRRILRIRPCGLPLTRQSVTASVPIKPFRQIPSLNYRISATLARFSRRSAHHHSARGRKKRKSTAHHEYPGSNKEERATKTSTTRSVSRPIERFA